jgi:hypothetical protein
LTLDSSQIVAPQLTFPGAYPISVTSSINIPRGQNVAVGVCVVSNSVTLNNNGNSFSYALVMPSAASAMRLIEEGKVPTMAQVDAFAAQLVTSAI